jgi:hypothetical protein
MENEMSMCTSSTIGCYDAYGNWIPYSPVGYNNGYSVQQYNNGGGYSSYGITITEQSMQSAQSPAIKNKTPTKKKNQAKEESNIEWLDRRVQEVRDLVAA